MLNKNGMSILCLALLAGLAYPHTNISSCQTLNTTAETYTLTADIGNTNQTCLTINAARIALDCNGHTITGYSNVPSTYGILATANDSQIHNCNVTNYAYGVAVRGTDQDNMNAVAVITNTSSVGYWDAKPCSAYDDQFICNEVSGCYLSEATGVCTGVMPNPCYGLSDRACASDFQCQWVDWGCGYCTTSPDRCAEAPDKASCGELGDVCSWDGCGCTSVGISCGIITDEPTCRDAECTWVPTPQACLGDSSCLATLTCAAYYMSYVNDLTMTNTSSPSGAIGYWGQGTNKTAITNAVYNNSKYGVYAQQITNMTLEGSSITSDYDMAIYDQYGNGMTISNTNVTSISLNKRGIYSFTPTGMTIKNSNVKSSGIGIELTAATGTSIFNTTSNSSDNAAVALATSINATIDNLTSTAYDYGLVIESPINVTVSNLNVTDSYNGVLIQTGTVGITLTNATINSEARGLWIYQSQNTNIGNVSITGTSASSVGVAIDQGSNNTLDRITAISNTSGIYLYDSDNNTITNGNFNGGYYGVFLRQASHDNLFRNNTVTSAQNALTSEASSYNNTICLNNFTNIGVPTYYVQDFNGGNFYNCTYNGKNQGNLFENVVNGTVNVTGTNASSIAGLYIGTAGAGVPYSNATSAGMFQCSFADCQDNAPLTPFSSGGNTCTPPASGNWTLNCADACTVSNNVLALDYILYAGTGTVNFRNVSLTYKGEKATTIAGTFCTFNWKNYTIRREV